MYSYIISVTMSRNFCRLFRLFTCQHLFILNNFVCYLVKHFHNLKSSVNFGEYTKCFCTDKKVISSATQEEMSKVRNILRLKSSLEAYDNIANCVCNM